MKLKKLFLALGLASCLVTQNSLASDHGSNSSTGTNKEKVYFGFNITDKNPLTTNFLPGGDFYVGYQYSPNIAMGMSYRPKPKDNFEGPLNEVYAEGFYHMNYIGENFVPYLVGGVGIPYKDPDGLYLITKLGGGTELNINNSVGFNIGFEGMIPGKSFWDSYMVVHVGMNFRF